MNNRALKFLAVPLAAATLVGALAVSTRDAEARRWHRGGYGYGPAIGVGVAAAILGTAAIAAASAPRCEMVPVYDRWGNVIRYRRYC